MMKYHETKPISMDDFLHTICEFSYRGDIRLKYKMENPNKVRNLVEGSRAQLTQLYLPILLEFQEQGHLSI